MADQNEYMYYQQDPDPQNRYSYQDPIPTSGGPVGPEHSPKKPGGWRKILAPIVVLVFLNLAQTGLFSGIHRDLSAAMDDIAAILDGAKEDS